MDAVGDHIQNSVEGLSDDAIERVCEKLILLLHDGFLLFSNKFKIGVQICCLSME